MQDVLGRMLTPVKEKEALLMSVDAFIRDAKTRKAYHRKK